MVDASRKFWPIVVPEVLQPGVTDDGGGLP
jgi:hypothetical protein